MSEKWATGGILVKKGPTRESTDGKPHAPWKLSTLSKEGGGANLLVLGTAFTEHCKEVEGTVFIVIGAQASAGTLVSCSRIACSSHHLTLASDKGAFHELPVMFFLGPKPSASRQVLGLASLALRHCLPLCFCCRATVRTPISRSSLLTSCCRSDHPRTLGSAKESTQTAKPLALLSSTSNFTTPASLSNPWLP